MLLYLFTYYKVSGYKRNSVSPYFFMSQTQQDNRKSEWTESYRPTSLCFSKEVTKSLLYV